jgi:hypothetical protein
VIEGSRADVSFIAGLLLDKIGYHLPLYRQHQRLTDAGITVSRPWLTQLAQQGAGLLAPIYDAPFESIRASRVKAMDETPIKAGRTGAGKMKATYYWPLYGEQDEVCFPWFASRAAEHVYRALGLAPGAAKPGHCGAAGPPWRPRSLTGRDDRLNYWPPALNPPLTADARPADPLSEAALDFLSVRTIRSSGACALSSLRTVSAR